MSEEDSKTNFEFSASLVYNCMYQPVISSPKETFYNINLPSYIRRALLNEIAKH